MTPQDKLYQFLTPLEHGHNAWVDEIRNTDLAEYRRRQLIVHIARAFVCVNGLGSLVRHIDAFIGAYRILEWACQKHPEIYDNSLPELVSLLAEIDPEYPVEEMLK